MQFAIILLFLVSPVFMDDIDDEPSSQQNPIQGNQRRVWTYLFSSMYRPHHHTDEGNLKDPYIINRSRSVHKLLGKKSLLPGVKHRNNRNDPSFIHKSRGIHKLLGGHSSPQGHKVGGPLLVFNRGIDKLHENNSIPSQGINKKLLYKNRGIHKLLGGNSSPHRDEVNNGGPFLLNKSRGIHKLLGTKGGNSKRKLCLISKGQEYCIGEGEVEG